jgi:hypothetical protein
MFGKEKLNKLMSINSWDIIPEMTSICVILLQCVSLCFIILYFNSHPCCVSNCKFITSRLHALHSAGTVSPSLTQFSSRNRA